MKALASSDSVAEQAPLVMTMNILKGVSIPGSYPSLFLSTYRTLVVGDLHLGYEYALNQKGVYLPQSSYQYVRYVIDDLIKMTHPESIVFLGDVKHEFGKPTPQEWEEVKDLLLFLFSQGLSVHVVRGNHDNYILAILKKFNVGLHDPYMHLGDFVLIHGDKEAELPEGVRTIIMAHEHPAVSSRDLSGARYKFKCFLVGRCKKYRIVVVPALSILSAGVGINEMSREELLSPILKNCDIDRFTPFVVEEKVGVFRFPQIGVMRQI